MGSSQVGITTGQFKDEYTSRNTYKTAQMTAKQIFDKNGEELFQEEMFTIAIILTSDSSQESAQVKQNEISSLPTKVSFWLFREKTSKFYLISREVSYNGDNNALKESMNGIFEFIVQGTIGGKKVTPSNIYSEDSGLKR